jgi:hypothetical protein
MDKYSAEELHYMDDNQVSPGSDRLAGFLAEIFSKFGDEPAGWIYVEKNCCFIVSPGGKDLGACHLSREDLRSHIVLLPYDFFERYDRNPRGTIMLILHEVSHAFLNHHGTISPDVERQQELDAWKLAAKWYRSSDLSRKGRKP